METMSAQTAKHLVGHIMWNIFSDVAFSGYVVVVRCPVTEKNINASSALSSCDALER